MKSKKKKQKSIKTDIKMIQLLELSGKNFKRSCKYIQELKDGHKERTHGDTQQKKKINLKKESDTNFRAEKS